MTRTPPFPWPACTTLLFVLAFAGCQSANSRDASEPYKMKPPQEEETYTQTAADWPLRFGGHYFDTACYSTYGCTVRYGNYFKEDPDDELRRASSSVAAYPDVLGASWGPIRNFPPPAIVTWRSSDGTPHSAEIDMDAIFKDRLIHHNLMREETSENADIPDPGIILEVNDRTINVYMRAFISTKALQKPGNIHSNFRDDLIKVFSQTY